MREANVPFFTALARRCEEIQSSLCIGLDPDPRRLPRHLGTGPEATYRFCTEIIDATADAAAAFKPNLAFFESIGIEGWHLLDQILQTVPKGVPVILDAKRGDIGSTARHYARSLFDRLRGDAVTLSPYMGFDSIEPFMDNDQRGVYVLCLTSNPGSRDFQLHDDMYLRVARKVKEWNTKGNLGMVVGATRPQYLASILAVAPDIPLLVPGLGAQGGDLETLLTAAPGLPRHQLLFNVSRSILFASEEADFGRQARLAARYYCDRINAARDKARGATSAPAAQSFDPEKFQL